MFMSMNDGVKSFNFKYNTNLSPFYIALWKLSTHLVLIVVNGPPNTDEDENVEENGNDNRSVKGAVRVWYV